MDNRSKEDVYTQPQENLHCSSVLDSRKIGCPLFPFSSPKDESHESLRRIKRVGFNHLGLKTNFNNQKVGIRVSIFFSFYPIRFIVAPHLFLVWIAAWIRIWNLLLVLLLKIVRIPQKPLI